MLRLGLAVLLALVVLPASSHAAAARCFGVARTIIGNNNANALYGTSGRNVIVGLGGNDRIYPRSGADLVCSGSGNDVINAYDGFADRISCGPGRDTVIASYIDAISRDCERVRRINHKPTNLALSGAAVDENRPKGTIVGWLKVTDADPGDARRFRFVSGAGAGDNTKFTLDGSAVRSNALFDAEERSTASVRIRVEDAAGASYEKAFVIRIRDVNDAPITLTLSSTQVNEGLFAGKEVGTLDAFDQDVGETLTYALVPVAGNDDDTRFAVDGDVLRTTEVFDREAKGSYSVRIKVTDARGASLAKTFTISIGDVNEPPTDLSLSTSTTAEHQPVGSTVATLISNDPDIDTGDPQTFTLVTGTGDDDNASFTVSGSSLKSAAVFDAATKNSYTIRARVSDGVGFTSPARVFVITVEPVEDPPTDIALSSTAVDENAGIGATVGTLSTTDPDAGDTATFDLVPGQGGEDNTSFTISGTSLQAAEDFDFETKSSYSIRVQVTDGSAHSRVEVFTVSVNDLAD